MVSEPEINGNRGRDTVCEEDKSIKLEAEK